MHGIKLFSTAVTGMDLGVISYAGAYAPCAIAAETVLRHPSVQEATGLDFSPASAPSSFGYQMLGNIAADAFMLGCLWCHLKLGLFVGAGAKAYIAAFRLPGASLLAWCVSAVIVLGSVAARIKGCYIYGKYIGAVVTNMTTHQEEAASQAEDKSNIVALSTAMATLIVMLIIGGVPLLPNPPLLHHACHFCVGSLTNSSFVRCPHSAMCARVLHLHTSDRLRAVLCGIPFAACTV